MKLIRKTIFWIHLICGVVAGAVILIMSITGVILTFEEQITNWADTRRLILNPVSPTSPSLAHILEALETTQAESPTAVTKRLDIPGLLEVNFGRRKVYVDASNGMSLGEGATTTKAFFRSVTDWHRWIAAAGEFRSTGKAITGVANLMFLFLVISGIYLWFPRRWTLSALRNGLLFRRGLSSKARDFNWHNVIGFWSALPLVIIVFSGVVISYPWASNLVYRMVGEAPPARRGSEGRSPAGGNLEGRTPDRASNGRPSGTIDEQSRSAAREESSATLHAKATPPNTPDTPPLVKPRLVAFETVIAKAEAAHPGSRRISIQLSSKSEDMAVTADRGNGRQPQKRTKLTFSSQGEIIRVEPFSSGTTGTRVRSLLRFAHTGEVWVYPARPSPVLPRQEPSFSCTQD